MKKVILFILICTFVLLLILLRSEKSESPKQGSVSEDVKTYLLIDKVDSGFVSNYPNIPQYPNSSVAESRSYREEGGLGYASEHQTDDDILEVFDWYNLKLPKEGWEVVYHTKFDGETDTFLLEAEKRGEDKKEDILLSITGVKTTDDVKIIVTHHKGMGEYGATD
jgi:hypothetical protein